MKNEKVGLEDTGKIILDRKEISCNPIMQAELMNKANTDFNIVFGLSGSGRYVSDNHIYWNEQR